MASWNSRQHNFQNSYGEGDQSSSGESLPPATAIKPPRPQLPESKYIANDAMVENAFKEALAYHAIIKSEAFPAYPAVEGMVSRIHGIAQYHLRNGGNPTMFDDLITPAMGMALYIFAPIVDSDPDSPRGKDADACYKLLDALYEEYSYLKETSGMPGTTHTSHEEPRSGSPQGDLFTQLKLLGWNQKDDSHPVIEKFFVIQPWFSQQVILGWQPDEAILRAFVCDRESGDIPYWAKSFGAEIVGDNLVLAKRLEDPQALSANQVNDEAEKLANTAVSLVRMNVPPSHHQTIYIAPESDPESPEAQLLPILANTVVFGIWGPGQTAEGCFRELARLDPRVLDAFVMPTGGGFSADATIGWTVIESPAGAAALMFSIDSDQDPDIVRFGGPDVNPPYQVAFIGYGRTHGAIRAILEDCRIVPLESMPGMKLEISEDYALRLSSQGWESGGEDRSFFYLPGQPPVFLMVWNENHFGLFAWATDTTVATEPYQIQTLWERPCLVLTLGKDDPRLEPTLLAQEATELITHL